MQKSIFEDPLYFFNDKDRYSQRKRRYALGIFFIFLVSVIWIGSSVLSQYLYTECSFDSPFLVTYIGVCLFAFILPLKYLTDYVGCTRDTTIMAASCGIMSTPDDDITVTTEYRDMQDEKKRREREQRRIEKAQQRQQQTQSSELNNTKNNSEPLNPNNIVSTGSVASATSNQSGAVALSRSFSTVGLDLDHPGPHWNHSKHIFVALHIAPVLFIANWLFNASLQATSVVSATVLVSTSCLFVFVLAVLVKEEQFHIFKLIGVLLGILGSVLTARHDFNVQDEYDPYPNFDHEVYYDMDDDYYANTTPVEYTCTTADCDYNLWGDTLAVLAAVAFGAYAVQVRLLCPLDEELYSMGLLLGYIGVVVMIPLLPVAIILLTKVNLSWNVLFLIVLRGLFDYCFSEYLHFRAVILTNATIATVGLGLTIPMAFVADYIMGKDNISSISSLLGAVAVSAGFLLVNVVEDNNNHDGPHGVPSTKDEQQSSTVPTEITNSTYKSQIMI